MPEIGSKRNQEAKVMKMESKSQGNVKIVLFVQICCTQNLHNVMITITITISVFDMCVGTVPDLFVRISF
jgi:hypothetical protein